MVSEVEIVVDEVDDTVSICMPLFLCRNSTLMKRMLSRACLIFAERLENESKKSS